MVKWLIKNKFGITKTNLWDRDYLNIKNNPNIYEVLVKHAKELNDKMSGDEVIGIINEGIRKVTEEDDNDEDDSDEEENSDE